MNLTRVASKDVAHIGKSENWTEVSLVCMDGSRSLPSRALLSRMKLTLVIAIIAVSIGLISLWLVFGNDGDDPRRGQQVFSTHASESGIVETEPTNNRVVLPMIEPETEPATIEGDKAVEVSDEIPTMSPPTEAAVTPKKKLSLTLARLQEDWKKKKDFTTGYLMTQTAVAILLEKQAETIRPDDLPAGNGPNAFWMPGADAVMVLGPQRYWISYAAFPAYGQLDAFMKSNQTGDLPQALIDEIGRLADDANSYLTR